MTYEAAVEYIHSLLAFGIQPGLERITALLEALGNPHRQLRFVHVAGTNGKGSTATMLSEVFKAAGFKTGLFTSPYVFDFCERIQINNQNIPHRQLARVVKAVKEAIEELAKREIRPTEFEAITAAAMLYFQQEHCTMVVLEVGLGGRFDSTNVIDCPEAAVITSVSLDHTRILGDTIEKIAFEKSGIIKRGGTVITTSAQNPQALAVIANTAREQAARLLIGDITQAQVRSEALAGTDMTYAGLSVHISLAGRHQVENAVGVIEAARAVGVQDCFIQQGLAQTKIRGRMELLPTTPPVLLDGGHNPECAAALKQLLQTFAAPYEITAVIGMMADKDCAAYLAEILPLCRRVVFTAPNNPRAAQASELAALARPLVPEILTETNPKRAFEIAKRITPPGGLLLLCGSFYLLSDVFRRASKAE